MSHHKDNPWAESIDNCLTGDNYLRSSELNQINEDIDSYCEDVAALRAECAELRKDAERYRFLRTPRNNWMISQWASQPAMNIMRIWNELDAAIDAELKGKP